MLYFFKQNPPSFIDYSCYFVQNIHQHDFKHYFYYVTANSNGNITIIRNKNISPKKSVLSHYINFLTISAKLTLIFLQRKESVSKRISNTLSANLQWLKYFSVIDEGATISLIRDSLMNCREKIMHTCGGFSKFFFVKIHYPSF